MSPIYVTLSKFGTKNHGVALSSFGKQGSSSFQHDQATTHAPAPLHTSNNRSGCHNLITP